MIEELEVVKWHHQCNMATDCVIVSPHHGRSQEFGFTEARLKGKGISCAGGLGGCAPRS